MYAQLKSWKAPLVATAMVISGIAGAQQKTPPPPPPVKVTAPKPPTPPAVRDFNDARKELDRASAELEQAMRNLPEPPTPPQIDEAALNKSLKELDGQIAKIDRAAISREMEQARKDMEQARKDMEQARVHQQQAMKQMETEMKNIRPKIEAEMKEARIGMEKARKDLEAYESFVNSLAADGLISKSGYSIEHRNGTLIIDGKEQPESVYNKYKSFLQDKKGVRITKNEQGLNIQRD